MRLAYLEQAYLYGQCPLVLFEVKHPQANPSNQTIFGLHNSVPSSGNYWTADRESTMPAAKPPGPLSATAVAAAKLAAAKKQRAAKEAAAAQEKLQATLAKIRQDTLDTAEDSARSKINAARRRFELQLERVQRQLADREREAQVEADLHEESLATMKRWYTQKWIAIKSKQLETHFASKLEQREAQTESDRNQWEEERATLSVQLQESERHRHELASQADRLKKENHGIKMSRDQQVRGLVYKLSTLERMIDGRAVR